jgi:zinc transport system ATP-binding protein
MSYSLLSLDHVSFRAQGVSILEDVSLHLYQGELVTLIGPNGSGKSTLLKILLGLLKPTSGQVFKDSALKIGYVPQKFNLNPSIPLSVDAFLKISLGSSVPSQEWMEALNIESLRKRPMASLSGGEIQKVLLARALLRAPHVLVLDEPAQGMDVHAQSVFYHLLETWIRRLNVSILLVSHDLYFVHAKSDRVICLNHHICCAGKPQEMVLDPMYKHLFGPVLETLALYPHHHDHEHDL